jgi:hypothetical protein
VDFTREPIIETVITPREGHKIVVRNSKNAGQEEYFVEAVEVVSFGSSTFFRSVERPKPFLVPTSDYEVLEVREARIVLKNVGLDRSIKIAGGKEPQPQKQVREEKPLPEQPQAQPQREDARSDRRKDRRRQQRRRRGGPAEENSEESSAEETKPTEGEAQVSRPAEEGEVQLNGAALSQLLTPPPTLISETLLRYKENALFKDAFYTKEELSEAGDSLTPPPLPEPGLFESILEETNISSEEKSDSN